MVPAKHRWGMRSTALLHFNQGSFGKGLKCGCLVLLLRETGHHSLLTQRGNRAVRAHPDPPVRRHESIDVRSRSQSANSVATRRSPVTPSAAVQHRYRIGSAITSGESSRVTHVRRHIVGNHPCRRRAAGQQHVHGHAVRAQVLRHDQRERLGPGARRPIGDEAAPPHRLVVHADVHDFPAAVTQEERHDRGSDAEVARQVRVYDGGEPLLGDLPEGLGLAQEGGIDRAHADTRIIDQDIQAAPRRSISATARAIDALIAHIHAEGEGLAPSALSVASAARNRLHHPSRSGRPVPRRPRARGPSLAPGHSTRPSPGRAGPSHPTSLPLPPHRPL